MKTLLISQLITYLTPMLVPLVLAAAKKGIGALPSWLIPILAPILGAVLDVVNAQLTGFSGGGMLGAILGAAGVGLREIIDQLKKALAGG